MNNEKRKENDQNIMASPINIWLDFEILIYGIRNLCNEICGYADENDKIVEMNYIKKIEKFRKFIDELDQEDILNKDDSIKIENSNDIKLYETSELSSKETFNDPAFDSKENKHNKKEIIEEILYELSKFSRSFSKKLPIQGLFIRISALIMLTSAFEKLILDLIKFFYSSHPSALNNENRKLSLNDLRNLNSIEEAQYFLIEQEICSVMWQNTDFQIKYLKNKPLHVNLNELGNYIIFINEIFQRRNIWVHNNGIVNRQYIDYVDKILLQENKVELNKTLLLDLDYLNNAMDYIAICGIIILQKSWRQWLKHDLGEIKKADSILLGNTYESLIDKRYSLVVKIGEFSEKLKIVELNNALKIKINLAIALKELGRIEEMSKILNGYDWSAVSIEYHIALNILRDQFDKVFQLLPKAIKSEKIDLSALNDWPIFNYIRNDKRYIDLIKDISPEIKT